jgi:hypothetical protein
MKLEKPSSNYVALPPFPMPHKPNHTVSPGRYQTHAYGWRYQWECQYNSNCHLNAPWMSDPLQQLLERRGILTNRRGSVTKTFEFLGFCPN